MQANNRKKAFLVRLSSRTLSFPYSKTDPPPSPGNGIQSVDVDLEAAREAFTFTLISGQQGTVHVEQVLEYNQDPDYLRDLLLYKLTLEAQNRVATSYLSKREIIRRLGTSPSQFYRLLDHKNYRKSVDQLLRLLHVLDADIKLIVRGRVSKGKEAA